MDFGNGPSGMQDVLRNRSAQSCLGNVLLPPVMGRLPDFPDRNRRPTKECLILTDFPAGFTLHNSSAESLLFC